MLKNFNIAVFDYIWWRRTPVFGVLFYKEPPGFLQEENVIQVTTTPIELPISDMAVGPPTDVVEKYMLKLTEFLGWKDFKIIRNGYYIDAAGALNEFEVGIVRNYK